MTRPHRTRVVMVDQHALLAESLGVVFEMRHYDYRVVPQARGPGRIEQLLSSVRSLRPDVLLINADLGPTCTEAALIAPLAHVGVGVVVITQSTDEARWGECLARGARIVLSKSESLATVTSTVRRISRCQRVLDRAERWRLIGVYRGESAQLAAERSRLATLSPQEAEVLRLMMAGHTVTEISQLRVVAEGTVRTQVRSIRSKLQVSSQLAAVAVARRGGWVEPAAAVAVAP